MSADAARCPEGGHSGWCAWTSGRLPTATTGCAYEHTCGWPLPLLGMFCRRVLGDGAPEGGPLRNAVQLRHIHVAQRGNPRVGQDILHERIAVRYTALLHIGEFQQLGSSTVSARFSELSFM